MDYEKIYHSLAQSRKSRGLDKSKLDFVTEKHHIIPRCLGGGDEESNLVLLTYREHIIMHDLLAKYKKGSECYKCLRSYQSMCFLIAPSNDNRKPTTRQLAKAREAAQEASKALMLSLSSTGDHQWQTEEYSLYMKARNAAKSSAGEHNFQSNAFKLYKSEFQRQTLHCHCGKTGKRGGMGKAHMLNCKYKPCMSLQLALLGLNASMQISLVKYAEVHRTPTACPHCGKVGKGPMQLRWHFDNCKFTNN